MREKRATTEINGKVKICWHIIKYVIEQLVPIAGCAFEKKT